MAFGTIMERSFRIWNTKPVMKVVDPISCPAISNFAKFASRQIDVSSSYAVNRNHSACTSCNFGPCEFLEIGVFKLKNKKSDF
jgi:hypothetical protein